MVFSGVIAQEAVHTRPTPTLGASILRQTAALEAVAIVPDLPASEHEARGALAGNLDQPGQPAQ
jgi:hypothetical protein